MGSSRNQGRSADINFTGPAEACPVRTIGRTGLTIAIRKIYYLSECF